MNSRSLANKLPNFQSYVYSTPYSINYLLHHWNMVI